MNSIDKRKLIVSKEETKNMRERSDCVTINSKLVSFLYELMRDHLPAGEIEKIVQASQEQTYTLYTNGWLARYAEDVANRLK